MAIDKPTMDKSADTFSVFIGWDDREAIGSYVAAHSIIRRSSIPLHIQYIKHRELRKQNKFARPWIIEPTKGEYIDMIDFKPFSTQFSHTRFLVPHLMGYKGWALFMDADMVFTSDIKKLVGLIDDKYAMMCVKHIHKPDTSKLKMDGREQTSYNRKNWSSFVLWNCGHPANAFLTPEKVNFMPGKDMHQFVWLKDEQIGELPYSYNYISGVSPKRNGSRGFEMPDVIHYTEGGPWFDECQEVPFGKFWLDEEQSWQEAGCVKDFNKPDVGSASNGY